MTEVYRIESGLDIPEKAKFSIIDTLEPGQSVLISGYTLLKVSQACGWRQRRYGRRYTCRTIKDQSAVRVWRIS